MRTSVTKFGLLSSCSCRSCTNCSSSSPSCVSCCSRLSSCAWTPSAVISPPDAAPALHAASPAALRSARPPLPPVQFEVSDRLVEEALQQHNEALLRGVSFSNSPHMGRAGPTLATPIAPAIRSQYCSTTGLVKVSHSLLHPDLRLEFSSAAGGLQSRIQFASPRQ